MHMRVSALAVATPQQYLSCMLDWVCPAGRPSGAAQLRRFTCKTVSTGGTSLMHGHYDA